MTLTVKEPPFKQQTLLEMHMAVSNFLIAASDETFNRLTAQISALTVASYIFYGKQRNPAAIILNKLTALFNDIQRHKSNGVDLKTLDSTYFARIRNAAAKLDPIVKAIPTYIYLKSSRVLYAHLEDSQWNPSNAPIVVNDIKKRAES